MAKLMTEMGKYLDGVTSTDEHSINPIVVFA